MSDKTLRVLIRIDVQNDFMPGGSLPVPAGHEIVPVLNDLSRFGKYHLVVDTRDDHPPDHGSFISQHPGAAPFSFFVLNGIRQQLSPDHCVHGTHGCALHPDLDCSMVAATFPKGQDKRVDSYSGLYDNGRHVPASLKSRFNFLADRRDSLNLFLTLPTRTASTKLPSTAAGWRWDIASHTLLWTRAAKFTRATSLECASLKMPPEPLSLDKMITGNTLPTSTRWASKLSEARTSCRAESNQSL